MLQITSMRLRARARANPCRTRYRPITPGPPTQNQLSYPTTARARMGSAAPTPSLLRGSAALAARLSFWTGRDRPGESRIAVVPLRAQMQSETGTSLGTPYCCSGHMPEARTADSTISFGCSRPRAPGTTTAVRGDGSGMSQPFGASGWHPCRPQMPPVPRDTANAGRGGRLGPQRRRYGCRWG